MALTARQCEAATCPSNQDTKVLFDLIIKAFRSEYLVITISFGFGFGISRTIAKEPRCLLALTKTLV